jgi:hypothetical protein
LDKDKFSRCVCLMNTFITRECYQDLHNDTHILHSDFLSLVRATTKSEWRGRGGGGTVLEIKSCQFFKMLIYNDMPTIIFLGLKGLFVD